MLFALINFEQSQTHLFTRSCSCRVCTLFSWQRQAQKCEKKRNFHHLNNEISTRFSLFLAFPLSNTLCGKICVRILNFFLAPLCPLLHDETFSSSSFLTFLFWVRFSASFFTFYSPQSTLILRFCDALLLGRSLSDANYSALTECWKNLVDFHFFSSLCFPL